MREMKDSGIDIVKDIPADWSIIRLKYLCDIQTGNQDTQDADEDGEFNFYVRSPIIEKSTRYTFDGEGILMAGDGAGAGRIFHHAFGKYAVHQRVYRLSNFKAINSYYLFYYLSNLFNVEMDKGSAQSTVPSVRLPMLLNFGICIPSIDEQNRISIYLENKCNELQILVSDIQSQIEALEEYKRSVITEAVTKGLDPDVEMKESGVQWMGKIPKHWTVDNPKWHFVQRKDRATKGLTQLTASQKYGVVTQEEYMEITGAKVVTVEKDFDILKLVCPGDFIIHMRSFQGGLEYSEKYGSISSAYVMLIPQKTILEPRFYKWFFKSPVYIDALSSTSNLIRDGQAMRYANFIQLPIPLMPKEEQQQIADYLDMKCAEIDNIIIEKKQQIDTIEEYKKSLIFEYVTGKKEVASTLQVVTIHPALMLALVLREFGDDLKGKIHAQKAAYLSEMMLGSRPNAQYYRYEQGPYDEELDNYLKQIHKRQWFTIHNGNPMTCSKGKKYSEFEAKYKDLISKYSSEIKKIVDFLRPMRSSQAGRVATLYAVWNDFMIDGITNPTDSQLIDEITTNWTPNKSNPDKSTWQDTLNKMKAAGIVPTGYGLHTKAKEMRHI